jgi:hypothetical protein
MSASMAAFSVGGEGGDLLDEVAEAVVQIDAEAAKVAACLAKRSLKNTRTARPKMMGSETFIMVALRWSEKSVPSALALAICCGVEGTRAFLAHDGGVEDLAGLEGVFSLRTGGRCRRRRAGTNSMRTVVAAATVTDFSLEKKSSVAHGGDGGLRVGDHLPMEWGWARA